MYLATKYSPSKKTSPTNLNLLIDFKTSKILDGSSHKNGQNKIVKKEVKKKKGINKIKFLDLLLSKFSIIKKNKNKKGIINAIGRTQTAKEIETDRKIIFLKFCFKKKLIRKKLDTQKKTKNIISLLL
jgi:hypothetical protein